MEVINLIKDEMKDVKFENIKFNNMFRDIQSKLDQIEVQA